jgi:hypothetical protein
MGLLLLPLGRVRVLLQYLHGQECKQSTQATGSAD